MLHDEGSTAHIVPIDDTLDPQRTSDAAPYSNGLGILDEAIEGVKRDFRLTCTNASSVMIQEAKLLNKQLDAYRKRALQRQQMHQQLIRALQMAESNNVRKQLIYDIVERTKVALPPPLVLSDSNLHNKSNAGPVDRSITSANQRCNNENSNPESEINNEALSTHGRKLEDTSSYCSTMATVADTTGSNDLSPLASEEAFTSIQAIDKYERIKIWKRAVRMKRMSYLLRSIESNRKMLLYELGQCRMDAMEKE